MAHSFTRLLLLALLSFISGLMFLYPQRQVYEQERIFFQWWWSQQEDSIAINLLDSLQIQNFPISPSAKRTLEYRRKKDWPFKSFEQFKTTPGLQLDSLWWSRGLFTFEAPVKEIDQQARAFSISSRPYDSYRDFKKIQHQPTKPLDLSIADSTALVAVPGIGAWTARQIIDYRDRYGYIASLEHLKSSTYLGSSWRATWDTLLIPSSDTITLSLNESPFKALQNFPEFNFAQTKRIVFYRENFGRLKWSDLVLWEEFEGIDTIFLKLYISE